MRAVTARRRFGQHFLEPSWVRKVIAAIDPGPDEVFIEIGPGRGALTIPLAAQAMRIVAYEIDRDLVTALRQTVPGNVTVIPGDFRLSAGRQLTGEALPTSGFRVAGNLPYNVASSILFKLVHLYDQRVPIRDATIMLQREVADRVTAEPGSRDYGALTVRIRHSANVDRLLDLPAGAFRPVPKVRSSLVRLRLHAPDPPVKDRAVFNTLVQAVFGRRRKTMANALRAYPGYRPELRPDWLDLGRRPETLSIAEFARLADELSK